MVQSSQGRWNQFESIVGMMEMKTRKKSIQQLRKIECKEKFENQSINGVEDFEVTTISGERENSVEYASS